VTETINNREITCRLKAAEFTTKNLHDSVFVLITVEPKIKYSVLNVLLDYPPYFPFRQSISTELWEIPEATLSSDGKKLIIKRHQFDY
jgi:hypothetical protein